MSADAVAKAIQRCFVEVRAREPIGSDPAFDAICAALMFAASMALAPRNDSSAAVINFTALLASVGNVPSLRIALAGKVGGWQGWPSTDDAQRFASKGRPGPWLVRTPKGEVGFAMITEHRELVQVLLPVPQGPHDPHSKGYRFLPLASVISSPDAEGAPHAT